MEFQIVYENFINLNTFSKIVDKFPTIDIIHKLQTFLKFVNKKCKREPTF